MSEITNDTSFQDSPDNVTYDGEDTYDEVFDEDQDADNYDEAVDDEAVGDETVDEQVVDEEVVDDEVVDEEVVDDEVVDEQDDDDEVVDEQVVDEQDVDEQVVDEQVVDEQVVDEQDVDEQVIDGGDEQVTDSYNYSDYYTTYNDYNTNNYEYQSTYTSPTFMSYVTYIDDYEKNPDLGDNFIIRVPLWMITDKEIQSKEVPWKMHMLYDKHLVVDYTDRKFHNYLGYKIDKLVDDPRVSVILLDHGGMMGEPEMDTLLNKFSYTPKILIEE
jgi:hypothetical protein